MADLINDVGAPQAKLATGVGGTPAKKPSVFDPPAQTVKGNGKSYDQGGHNDAYAPVTPGTEPGFTQRVRSMATDGAMNSDTSLANGVTQVTRPNLRAKAIDAAVDAASR